MASERSFTDRVQKGRDLSAAVTLMEPAYEPADMRNQIGNLDAVITIAEDANADVEEKRIPYVDNTSDRNALLKTIGPIVTQSLAYVKSNSSWNTRYEALKKAADKVRGVPPPSSRRKDPDPDAKKREVGERSYEEIAAHLKTYNERLEALGAYSPPDPKITLVGLGNLYTSLRNYNLAIPSISRLLADAISDRQLAYTGPNGLKSIFDGVKASVKGQYGLSSPQYQSIRGIRW